MGLLLSREEQRRRAFERSAGHIARALHAVISSAHAEPTLPQDCARLLGASGADVCERALEERLLRCWERLMGPGGGGGARRPRRPRAAPLVDDPDFDASAEESGADEPPGSQQQQHLEFEPPPPQRRRGPWLGPGWPSPPRARGQRAAAERQEGSQASSSSLELFHGSWDTPESRGALARA
eukprot:Transcript_18166.p4 GENE.Transcript_18166~~Transcript_18166.p4  ORF type:complete len:182 (-),score=66.65 Transcript_18166:47-592(-)